MKTKLTEAASEHIKHRVTDGYETDMKRRADHLAFLDKIIELGKKLQ